MVKQREPAADVITLAELEKRPVTYYDVRDQLKRYVYAATERHLAAGDEARDRIGSLDELAARQRYIRAETLASIGASPESSSPDAGTKSQSANAVVASGSSVGNAELPNPAAIGLSPGASATGSSESPLASDSAPLPPARVTGTLDCGSYRIENVLFYTAPHTAVSANLYVPKGAHAGGGVLFLCGHEPEGKTSYYREVCPVFAEAGLVTLCIDFIGQGERLSYLEPETGKPLVPPCTAEHTHVGMQCLPLGESLATVFLRDAAGALDYLRSRPEVDPGKVGVTGNSGGGLVTSLLMLCDSTIAAAAPGTFLMNRRTGLYSGKAQDSEQIWPGFSARGLDHEDMLIAMAPRPVLVLAASYDFFPIEGTRESVERTRRFWELAGNPDGLRLYEEQTGHRYTEGMAKEAARFFVKELGVSGKAEALAGDRSAAAMTEAGGGQPIDPAALQCTRSGHIQLDDPTNRTVRDDNASRVQELAQRRLGLPPAERKETARRWLLQTVLEGRERCSMNPRILPMQRTESGLDVRSLLWRSQPDLMLHGYLFTASSTPQAALTGTDAGGGLDSREVTVALWRHGTDRLEERVAWITQTCAAGRAVLVVDLSGIGKLTPQPLFGDSPYARFEVLHKLGDDLLWIGDSLAALRVFDLIRALDVLQELPGCSAEGTIVHAEGEYALYAELAARLDDRITKVELREPLASVGEWVSLNLYEGEPDWQGILLPGMLNYLDITDDRPD